MGRLDQKVAIITGASDGLGRVMATTFSEEGAALVLAARRNDMLQDTARLVREGGGTAVAVTTDVTQEEDVVAMVDVALDEYGRVDVLINNAAQPGRDLYIWDQTLENWNGTIAIDVTAAMLCTREVLRQGMLERRAGSIVNVSSTAGWNGIPRKSHYCVAKAGLRTLTKVAAQEAGPYGIRVNCLVPGGIQTELLHNYWKRLSAEQEVPWQEIRDRSARAVALERVATPDEVTAAALFLASNESSAITGQSINVDCGGILVG